MQQPQCEICGDPTDATVCLRETRNLAGYLRQVITVAEDVEASVAGLARHSDRGGRRIPGPDTEPDTDGGDERRRLPVTAHGWAARLDTPTRGALRPTDLPYHPGMERRAAHNITTITTWARRVCEERGIGVPAPGPVIGPLCRSGWGCNHPTCDKIRSRTVDHPAARAATFLLTQLEWIRHRPEAAEMIDDLSGAAAALRRCVDSPPRLVVVGVCDCGEHLYAREGAGVATCPQCRARWDVAASREILTDALADRLFTAAEAGTLLVTVGVATDRDRARKTIIMWAQRGLITAHGQVDGDPTYRLGDLIERASRPAAP